MRKILYALVALLLIAACRPKNEPIVPQPTPNTQQPKPAPDSGEKPTPDPGKTPEKEQKPEPPAPKSELTAEDVAAYYGWSLEKSVIEIPDLLYTVKGEKEISGKKISITKAEIIELHMDKGAFSLNVTALVNNQEVSRQFEFSGFATPQGTPQPEPKTPENETLLARHATAKWHNAPQFEFFEYELVRFGGDLSRFTSEYMNQFMEFYSSFDGKMYTFTPDEVKRDIKVVDLQLDPSDKSIVTFYTTYKGIKSGKKTSLRVDLLSRYTNMLKVNTAAVAKLYPGGAAHHIAIYGPEFVHRYDSERFHVIAEESASTYDEYAHSINVSYKIVWRATSEELATVTKQISGFKSHDALAQELKIASSAELLQDMKRQFTGKSYSNGDVTAALRNRVVDAWISKALFTLHREGKQTELVWNDSYRLPDGSGLTRVLSAKEDSSDAFFLRPTFSFISARLQNGDLYLKVELSAINSSPVKGAVYEIVVKGVI